MPNIIRDLHIGEMLSVSAEWLSAEKSGIFLAIPEISPLISRVAAVHCALIDASESEASEAPLRALADQADALDSRHDHLVRALHYLLLASQYFHLGSDFPDEGRTAEIERANSALFPNDLRATLASYQAEASNAAHLEQLASNEFGGLLRGILIEKGTTALDLAQLIGKVGKQLGHVEQERSATAEAAKKKNISRAEIRRRMRAWASVAETVLGTLAQSWSDPVAVQAIREPLLGALERASARRREKGVKGKKDRARQTGPLETGPVSCASVS
jgi:hypothetical protein